PAALRAEKNGARVIISRGGTAEIIKKHVHIPVVEIRVSDLDILRVLYPFHGKERKILIAGYRNAVQRCRSVSEILDLDVHELLIPYEKEEYNIEDVKKAADQLIKLHRIDTIIGDQTAIANLKSLCENLHLIRSGRDDVMEAIERTETVFYGKAENVNYNRYVKNVLDTVNDAVISADNDGVIRLFNSSAEKIFNQQQKSVIGQKIESLLETQDCFGRIKQSITNVLRSGISNHEKIIKPAGGDYLINTSPILTDEKNMGVVLVIRELLNSTGQELKKYKKTIHQGFSTRYTFDDILTVNDAFRKKIRAAREYAVSDASILIEGESGTGKELFAQSIHSASSRSKAPFIAVNCAAIPAPLLESELFGYVEGAFTGASRKGKRGLFEIAHTGTIFLDEISEIDKSLQVKFLRVLEEKQIMRIGSDTSTALDVRVIAATNCDLKKQVQAGSFRSDLYYRLNLLNLNLPPLRKHCDDIEYLADHFYRVFNDKYGVKDGLLSEEVVDILKKYSWPGNIRELKNIIERIVLTAGSGKPDSSLMHLIADDIYSADCAGGSEAPGKTLDEIKYDAVLDMLKAENFNKSRAAQRLGIDRSTLDRLLSGKTKDR
ncbi:MAG: sigma 54-interacting transcriptional regulator, partial [Spirochaetia bacterium]|nr:sigma 54-interacting transcriptional regulator [Spirochaetia bacterium]